MGAASERRALLLEADDSYDPFLTIDVNEYLINEFPTLTAKQRQSVWHLCQNDEDFDYDAIHDQVDDWVFEYAESNPDVVLDNSSHTEEEPEEEEEEEDDDDDDTDQDEDSFDSLVFVDVQEYLHDNFDGFEADEIPYVTELVTYKFDYSSVYEQIDQIVSNYNDGQYDDELEDESQESDETTSS
jgi:predicted  nucleic acid-binding Zn-ribbon protein